MVGNTGDGGGGRLVDVNLVDGASKRGVRERIGAADGVVEDKGAGSAGAIVAMSTRKRDDSGVIRTRLSEVDRLLCNTHP